MTLNPEKLAQLNRDGFTTVEQLIDSATVAQLRDYYDKFLRREISAGENDRHLGGLTRQVMYPSRYHPYFRDNPAISAAREIARQVFQTAPGFTYDMLISKEPGNTNETPWHQDFSYNQQPVTPPGTPISNCTLQFWVALDDVTPANGCMHFIPGPPRGLLLEHYIASGKPEDPGRLLATKQVDPSKAVACPLKAGGCTIHFESTLHYTPGNTTKDRQRRAYIFNLNRP